jgi:hypothetical protein
MHGFEDERSIRLKLENGRELDAQRFGSDSNGVFDKRARVPDPKHSVSERRERLLLPSTAFSGFPKEVLKDRSCGPSAERQEESLVLF